jgi:hypothetical protein
LFSTLSAAVSRFDHAGLCPAQVRWRHANVTLRQTRLIVPFMLPMMLPMMLV